MKVLLTLFVTGKLTGVAVSPLPITSFFVAPIVINACIIFKSATKFTLTKLHCVTRVDIRVVKLPVWGKNYFALTVRGVRACCQVRVDMSSPIIKCPMINLISTWGSSGIAYKNLLFKIILTLCGLDFTSHHCKYFMFFSSCALNESGLLCTALRLGIMPVQSDIWPWVILVCRFIVNEARWWASFASCGVAWAFSC